MNGLIRQRRTKDSVIDGKYRFFTTEHAEGAEKGPNLNIKKRITPLTSFFGFCLYVYL